MLKKLVSMDFILGYIVSSAVTALTIIAYLKLMSTIYPSISTAEALLLGLMPFSKLLATMLLGLLAYFFHEKGMRFTAAIFGIAAIPMTHGAFSTPNCFMVLASIVVGIGACGLIIFILFLGLDYILD